MNREGTTDAAVQEPQLEPTAPVPQETIYAANPSDIFVREDRHRQLFKRKSLEELIGSIRDVGQSQPGVCHWNKEKVLELLIGERRLRACLLLQIPFKYYVKEEIKDPLLLEQIQLDENLCREELDWKDEVKAKERIHKILQERFGETSLGEKGGHSYEDTAAHIGIGKSILQEDVILAGFLTIPEVAIAKNKTTAKKIVKRLIEQVKRRDLLEKALGTADKLPIEQAPLTEQARAEAKLLENKRLDSWKQKAADAGKKVESREELNAFMEEHQAKMKSAAEIQLEKQLIYFNQRCILGDMEEKLLTFKDESFDIVCFDPPWGVEFDKVKKESAGVKSYEDNIWTFFEKIEEWLQLIYTKMKPNSHLYMFFGMGATPEGEELEKVDISEGFRYRDYIYDFLHTAGFNTNRMPLIWWKKGAHVTRNPEIWPGRAYEPIAYARKGSKPLAKMGAPDVIETPMPTSSLKDIHPSAKHPQIYRELLLRSAQPSDLILDPMGGSGMFGVAAESLEKTHSLNWFQIEIDQDYHNLQLLNLIKGFDELTKTEFIKLEDPIAEVTEGEKGDFTKLTPGTEGWTRHWKTYPEDQTAMLAWRQGGEK